MKGISIDENNINVMHMPLQLLAMLIATKYVATYTASAIKCIVPISSYMYM